MTTGKTTKIVDRLLGDWTEEEVKKIEVFNKKRKKGELGKPIVFKSVKELRKWLDDKL